MNFFPEVSSPTLRHSNVPVLLIYYNFRGIGQMIRYLLCYLQAPFIDILLDEYEHQKDTLPHEVLQVLRQKSINKNDLPAIIHNNEIIYELNQVMNYLCIVFQREDLLGANLYQKARVCEIQERYSMKLAQNIRFLSGFVSEIHQTSLQGEEMLAYVEQKLEYFFEESGYFKQLSNYLLAQGEQKFVLIDLTIVDFYFIESCRFAVGLFSNIDESLAKGNWIPIAESFRKHREQLGLQIRNVANLRAMKKFIDTLTSQPFYQQHQKYLQGFNQFPKSMSGEQAQGMKKLQANYFPDLYYKD